jgi:uncharacterized protein YyaL (SSP411 family)
MISAFAKAAQAFNNNIIVDAATKAYSFIEKYLTDEDGKLIHRFREGESGLPAHVDDYVFFINSLIDLYETTFEIKYLKRAIDLNVILIKEFWDEKNGGFYFTSSQSEKLLTRQKDVYDGAIPSGNSIALLNLIRLARLTTNTDLENKAFELVKYFSTQILRAPSAFTMFMCGLDFLYSDSSEIVIVSETADNSFINGINFIRSYFNPNKVLLVKNDSNSIELNKNFSFTSEMKLKNNKTTFYVCRNYTCNNPVNNIADLEILLKQ